MDNKSEARISLVISVGALILFAALTFSVLTLYVRPIGPGGSEIGLSGLNEYMLGIQNSIPDNIQRIFYQISETVGVVSIAVMFGFAVWGVVQLITRRSFKKIDLNLYFLAGLYAVMLVFYVFFEIVVINYRPIFVENALEASYPSSHTVLTLCVMISGAYVLCAKIKNRLGRVVLNVSAFVLAAVTVAGRFVSCVHWFTDIIGALFLSCALISLFLWACRRFSR